MPSYRLESRHRDKVISEIAGEDVLPVVKLLKKKKALSEIEIAEQTGMEINIVRNVLYRLYNHNLVFSERKKDRENGWYFYQWSLSNDGLSYRIKNLYLKRLNTLNQQLNSEMTNHFYSCENRCSRLEFDEAFSLNFKCPECGTILNIDTQNGKNIVNLKREIGLLEKITKGK